MTKTQLLHISYYPPACQIVNFREQEPAIARYKVATRGNNWKYGFETVEQAIKFERTRNAKAGIITAIVAYTPRRKGN